MTYHAFTTTHRYDVTTTRLHDRNGDTNITTIIVSHYKESTLGRPRWNKNNDTKMALHYVARAQDDIPLRHHDDTTT